MMLKNSMAGQGKEGGGGGEVRGARWGKVGRLSGMKRRDGEGRGILMLQAYQ